MSIVLWSWNMFHLLFRRWNGKFTFFNDFKMAITVSYKTSGFVFATRRLLYHRNHGIHILQVDPLTFQVTKTFSYFYITLLIFLFFFTFSMIRQSSSLAQKSNEFQLGISLLYYEGFTPFFLFMLSSWFHLSLIETQTECGPIPPRCTEC